MHQFAIKVPQEKRSKLFAEVKKLDHVHVDPEQKYAVVKAEDGTVFAVVDHNTEEVVVTLLLNPQSIPAPLLKQHIEADIQKLVR